MKNKKFNNLFVVGRKAAFVVTLIQLLLSCNGSKKYGIVKFKNDEKKVVCFRPLDANRIEYIIDFNLGYDDEVTRNLYLNMNVGDTIYFDYHPVNIACSMIVPPSQAEIGKRYTKVKYFVKSINGKEIDKLPNLAKPEKTSSDIKLLERHGVDWPKKERPVLVFPKSDLTRFFETMDKMDSIKGYQNLTKKPEKTKSFAEVFGRHGVDWPKKERPVLVFPKSDLTRFFETMDKMDSIKGYQR